MVQKFLDISSGDVEKNDFPGLHWLSSGILTLPNYMNSRISQLLFLVSQHFRINLFRNNLNLENWNNQEALVSIYFLLEYGDSNRSKVKLEVKQRDDKESELTNSNNLINLRSGQILIIKSRKIEISKCDFGDFNERAFLGQMSLIARSEFKNTFGF